MLLRNCKILFVNFFLIVATLLSGYKINQRQTITGIILKIQNDEITCMKENSDIEYFYCFKYKDDSIKDIDGKEISKNDIKIGDVIKIDYYDKEEKLYWGCINEIKRIKSIKITGYDIEKVENTNYYNSMDNVSTFINKINADEISFTIKDSNKNPYKYSDKYKIYVRGGTEVKKSSDISSKETVIYSNENNGNNENLIEKTYNWKNLYGTLKERKIYVCIRSK